MIRAPVTLDVHVSWNADIFPSRESNTKFSIPSIVRSGASRHAIGKGSHLFFHQDRFSSTKERDAHDRTWIRTIGRILSSSTDDILIVPHVQSARPAGDDWRIASRLAEATAFNPRVRVAWGELSASDFKGLLQDARYVIGERCTPASPACRPQYRPSRSDIP